MKKVLISMLLLIGIVACAAAFPYKWYGLDPVSGKLLGKTEAEDLPITICSPDSIQKGKCTVMLVDEFDRMRNDFVTLKERLKACERGR